jgi:hypothetical protein
LAEHESRDLYLEYLGRDVLLDMKTGVEWKSRPATGQRFTLIAQLRLHPLEEKIG